MIKDAVMCTSSVIAAANSTFLVWDTSSSGGDVMSSEGVGVEAFLPLLLLVFFLFFRSNVLHDLPCDPKKRRTCILSGKKNKKIRMEKEKESRSTVGVMKFDKVRGKTEEKKRTGRLEEK